MKKQICWAGQQTAVDHDAVTILVCCTTRLGFLLEKWGEMETGSPVIFIHR